LKKRGRGSSLKGKGRGEQKRRRWREKFGVIMNKKCEEAK